MKEESAWVEQRLGTMRAVDGRLVGHALVFNRLSEDLGNFVEIIRPGSLDGVLNDDIRCLIDHETSRLLGRTRSGTLSVRDDGIGLLYECKLPATTYASDLVVLVQRRDVSGCSFSFDVARDRWSQQGNQVLREILLLKRLYDVGPVVFPAYPDTDTSLRNKPVSKETWRLEHLRRRLELAATSSTSSWVLPPRLTTESPQPRSTSMEKAVSTRSPHDVRNIAMAVMSAERCFCGAASVEMTRDLAAGTRIGHCAKHGEYRAMSNDERRLQLAAVTAELRS